VRFRPRLDTTHAPIREALIAGGWQVLSLAQVGGGVPDFLIRKGRCWAFLDAKSPKRIRKSKERLEPKQVAFAERWPVLFAETPEEALLAAEALRMAEGAPQ
jgi:hypothetical protein